MILLDRAQRSRRGDEARQWRRAERLLAAIMEVPHDAGTILQNARTRSKGLLPGGAREKESPTAIRHETEA